MSITTVSLENLDKRFEKASAKVSVNLRNVDLSRAENYAQDLKPHIGDVLLARVVKLGDHTMLQGYGGRNMDLYEGDKILLPYGNRYAVQQYEAFVPDDLSECHMASKGGLAAKIVEDRSALTNPTIIRPIGILVDRHGEALNTSQFGIKPMSVKATSRPLNIVVLGTGMDAGKTTCAAEIVKGIARTGRAAGFGKLTGTGAFSDIHKPEDAGAIASADFVDLGFPSTYKLGTQTLIEMLGRLTSYLHIKGADVNVIEIADGVFQSDNQKLLKSDVFKSLIDGAFVAADSGPSALAAVRELKKRNVRVLGAGGLMTNTPLSVHELKAHLKASDLDMGVLDLHQLRKKGTANKLIKFCERSSSVKVDVADSYTHEVK